MSDTQEPTIVRIDFCFGCQKMARDIQSYACPVCRRAFGPRGGIFLKKIRESQTFAATVYDLMETSFKKKTFIKLFGLPPGCLEPGQKPLQDSRHPFHVVNGGLSGDPEDRDS